MKYFVSLLLFMIMLLTTAMIIDKPSEDLSLSNERSTKLDDIWYQGKAEINTYKLEQNRYKDLHDGEAVMIFVTEDFLTDKQVKNDQYKNKNSTPILKNNQIRRFTTGLYDYSMFTSVFNKIGDTHPLKITTSSQDWCGQSFMQLNKKGKNYKVQLNSYFESEGDKNFDVPDAILEDALFNIIRMNHEDLPIGEFNLLPSTITSRIKHYDYKVVKAKGALDKVSKSVMIYTLDIPEQSRTLKVRFEAQKPYKILGWEESLPSGFDKQLRTTKATLKHSDWIDYWTKNAKEDTELRASFKVDGFE